MSKKPEKSPKEKHIDSYMVDKLGHSSIDDVLAGYESVHSRKSEYARMDELVADKDALYDMLKKHISSHAGEPKEGEKPEILRSYKDLTIKGEKASAGEKKKAVEDLVNKWALHGLAKRWGKKVDEVKAFYKGNEDRLHDEIKDHVAKYMATENLQNFDSIVNYILDLDHVTHAFHTDRELQSLTSNYINRINNVGKSRLKHSQEILKRTVNGGPDWEKFQSYINKKLEPHSMEVENIPSERRIAELLQTTLPSLLNPDFHAHPAKQLPGLKEKKKDDKAKK